MNWWDCSGCLYKKGHYKETDQVFAYFIDRVKEYKKIGTAYVTSAMELTPQQKQAVEQKAARHDKVRSV